MSPTISSSTGLRRQFLWLFLISLCAATSDGYFRWFNPPGVNSSEISPDFTYNVVWTVDSVHDLSWQTNYATLQLFLMRENICHFSEWKGVYYSFLDRATFPAEEYSWRASIPAEDLSLSNVFYFRAQGWDAESNAFPPTTSHYFNISSNTTVNCAQKPTTPPDTSTSSSSAKSGDNEPKVSTVTAVISAIMSVIAVFLAALALLKKWKIVKGIFRNLSLHLSKPDQQNTGSLSSESPMVKQVAGDRPGAVAAEESSVLVTIIAPKTSTFQFEPSQVSIEQVPQTVTNTAPEPVTTQPEHSSGSTITIPPA
ncbi:hypothetical protein K402DRAFT_424134 [Aulographum hederae CBS 113979]|uniref:Mid2 domain-containing protein n=1 Tax=Aulographum hederae CBS 113979 TaxID=1176131 RepID=A0A6G1GQ52_9PEZI|nr:hypothetical protein K402DRAFT_424134 [Aulographum hederae CBS 113979]